MTQEEANKMILDMWSKERLAEECVREHIKYNELKQELEIMVKDDERSQETIIKLSKENEKLKELCDKYEEEHNTTFKEWQKDIQANKKAIEELKQAYTDIQNNDNANYIHIAFRNDLLNILQGESDK